MTATCDRLMARLHLGANLYSDFERAGRRTPYDPFGFEANANPWLLEGALSGSVTIEVGSWLGCSARAMAGAMRAEGRDGAVLCVDTWLGDWELNYNEYRKAMMNFQCGEPRIYDTFLSNVIYAGLEGYIVPLRLDSYNASRVLENLTIQADFIYIDGSHDAPIVSLDLWRYWGLLKPGGKMVIDDYDYSCKQFIGLINSVNEFCNRVGLIPDIGARKVRLSK